VAKNFVGAKGARLLRKVAKHILDEPKRFIMAAWFYKRSDYRPSVDDFSYHGDFPTCNTAACIGGWSVVLGSKKNPDDILDVQRYAARLLGLTPSRVAVLFDAWAWPTPFDKFQSATDPRKRAQIAAKRIEHFIKTGE